MDDTYRLPTAFDIVYDTFKDESVIEFYENDELPTVVDPWNPFSLSIEYNDKVWHCEARFWCKNPDEGFVQIVKEYTNEVVLAIQDIYKENWEGAK